MGKGKTMLILVAALIPILILGMIFATVALGLAGMASQSGDTCAGNSSGSTAFGIPAAKAASRKSVYVVGDSISVRLDQSHALKDGLRKKQFNLAKIDAKISRPLDEGISAIKGDGAAKSADIIVIELGTNNVGEGAGTFGNSVKKMAQTAHALNKSATVYWVSIFSTESPHNKVLNDVIDKNAGPEKYSVIDTTGAGIKLDGDNIHPTIPAGTDKLASVITDGLGGSQNASSSSADCGSGTTGSGSGDYVSPFSTKADGWTLARIDQGVDYCTSKALRVRAIGDGEVTYSTTTSGWPGGAYLTYKLTGGDHSGVYIFIAEQLTNLHPVGKISAGDVLATSVPNGHCTLEMGYSGGPTGSTARAYSCYKEGLVTNSGKEFARFLRKIGVPTRDNPGPGPDMPTGPLC